MDGRRVVWLDDNIFVLGFSTLSLMVESSNFHDRHVHDFRLRYTIGFNAMAVFRKGYVSKS